MHSLICFLFYHGAGDRISKEEFLKSQKGEEKPKVPLKLSHMNDVIIYIMKLIKKKEYYESS